MIPRGPLLLWIFRLLVIATGGSGALCANAAHLQAQPQTHPRVNPQAHTQTNSQTHPQANLSSKTAANPTGWNIPVLCYHTFYHGTSSRTPGPLDETYEGFEDMLHYLRENGFHSFLPDSGPLQGKPDPQKVIITFDDGHVSQLRAAELLEKYDMRGIFFVIPSRIDDPGYAHMTSRQLAKLTERGHLVAAHGHRHKSMPVSGSEIIAALDTVPDILKTIPGISEDDLHSIAYPYGHYSPAVRTAMLPQYPLQYTVNPGYWDGRSTLIPRILIASGTDRKFYYDYLKGAFAASKLLTMQEESGSRQSVVHFNNPKELDPDSLYIQATSPDGSGHHYSVFSAAPFLTSKNGVLVFDITDYLETHHSADRRALSFVVSQRGNGKMRYVSDGYLVWVSRTDW